MKRINIIILVFAILGTPESHACFILFLPDGQRVMLGNHEDWLANGAAIQINPQNC